MVSTRPLTFLVGTVAACHSPAAPPPSPSPTPVIRFASGRGALAVRVSDARTGALLQEPVAVLMRGVAEFEGEPGEVGWVAFREVPPGAYLLQVRRIGYVLRRDSVRVRPGGVDTVAAPLGVNLCDIGCDAVIVRRRAWWQFWRRGA